MNCTYFEERVSDYLEDALSAADRSAMDEHLLSCSACAELLDGVRHVMHWREELPAVVPPTWLAHRIVANTPQVIRITWRDWIVKASTSMRAPTFALGP